MPVIPLRFGDLSSRLDNSKQLLVLMPKPKHLEKRQNSGVPYNMHSNRLTDSDSELTVVHSGCSVESKQSIDLAAAHSMRYVTRMDEESGIRSSMKTVEVHTHGPGEWTSIGSPGLLL